MATPTYTPIASTTLASSASSVTFSSLNTIAAGYRDLVLIANPEITGGDSTLTLRLNSDTNNANYSVVRMSGDGSSATSTSATGSARLDANNQTSGSRPAILINIMDFSATDKHKSALVRINSTTDSVEATAFRFASTAAVTTVQLVATTNFAAGSTFSLYGIAA